MGLLKKFKGAVKKITKPISRVLDKVIPNEIKPFLPYAAAAVPFLAPTAGIFGSMAGRAALSGGANILSQLSQEGSEGDFSGLSALLAAGTGALSAPTAKSAIAQRFGSPAATGADAGFFVSEGINPGQAVINPGTSFVGEGLTSLAEGAGKTRDILSPGGMTAGLDKATFAAAAVPLGQGTTDLAMSTARKALKDYEDELAEYERMTGEAQTASDDARRTAIRAAMIAGGHSEDVISETFDLLGLKDGGRVGLREGGLLQQLTGQANQITIPSGFQPFARPLMAAGQMPVFPRLRELEQGIDTAESDLGSIRSRLGNQEGRLAGLMAIQPAFGLAPLQPPVGRLRIQDQLQFNPAQNMTSRYKDGGITGLKDGGMLDLEGKEMDLRGGGFVPIGKKERADDVPARLSKNEFVMTADAVRAAGGGDVNKGAKRMYETMNKLEARA